MPTLDSIIKMLDVVDQDRNSLFSIPSIQTQVARYCSETFKNVRKELKLTQSELADKINLPVQYIIDVESRERIPSSEIACRLYHASNIDTRSLD